MLLLLNVKLTVTPSPVESIAVKLRQNVIDYQVIELEPVFPLGIPDVFLHF
jgi:hypothetical protein